MRLFTIDSRSGPSAAVAVGDDILDIASALEHLGQDTLPRDMAALLGCGRAALDRVDALARDVGGSAVQAERMRSVGALTKASGTRLLAPVPKPGRILSCGANYKSHLAEMKSTLGAKPVAFLKNPGAVIGPDAAIVLPPGHDNMVDWEAEFSGVIGRSCHAISAEEALECVVAYTMIIDVSARNWVKPFHALPAMEAIAAWEENLLGKQFATFCPMGPAIVTADEFPDPAAVNFTLAVNGETKQAACTNDLVFSLASLISYYSQWYTFEPGDIVTTGCPAGVGFGMNPQQFLRPGDVVTVEAEGIGSMSHPVVKR